MVTRLLTFFFVQFGLQYLSYMGRPIIIGLRTQSNGLHHRIQVIQCIFIAVG